RTDSFITAEHLMSHIADSTPRIGIGDAVLISGLFAYLGGEKRNLPIVRMGNIAMMPGTERIPVERHKVRGRTIEDVEGYLIEVRSRSGMSGSPCFVRATIKAELRRDQLSSFHFPGGLSQFERTARNIAERMAPTLTSSPLGLDTQVGLLGLVF